MNYNEVACGLKQSFRSVAQRVAKGLRSTPATLNNGRERHCGEALLRLDPVFVPPVPSPCTAVWLLCRGKDHRTTWPVKRDSLGFLGCARPFGAMFAHLIIVTGGF